MKLGSRIKNFFRHEERLSLDDVRSAALEGQRMVKVNKELLSSRDADRAQLKQLQTIFNAMTQCVYVSDLYDHTVYFTNLKVDDLHGGISGRKCYELFQDNDAPCSFCTNARLLAGERVVEWEFYHPRLKKHFQIMDTIIDWPGVGPARLGVLTDITEQKRAEQAVRVNEMWLDLLLQNVQCGIVVHRAPDGKVLQSNAMADEILRPLTDGVDGKDLEDEAWQFVYESGEPVPVEDYPVSRVLRTGTTLGNYVFGIAMAHHWTRWVLCNAYPVKNDGEITHVVTSFVDITAQKHAEFEARAMSNACPVAIIFHRHGRVLALNKAFTELTGYTKADLESDSDAVWNTFVEKDIAEVHTRVDTDDTSSYNVEICRRDGRVVPVHIDISYMMYNNLPEPARVVVMMAHEYVERLQDSIT